jgi:hypothetical protein
LLEGYACRELAFSFEREAELEARISRIEASSAARQPRRQRERRLGGDQREQ